MYIVSARFRCVSQALSNSAYLYALFVPIRHPGYAYPSEWPLTVQTASTIHELYRGEVREMDTFLQDG